MFSMVCLDIISVNSLKLIEMSDKMIDGEDDYLQEPVQLHDVELVPHSPATVPQLNFLESMPLATSSIHFLENSKLLPKGKQV